MKQVRRGILLQRLEHNILDWSELKFAQSGRMWLILSLKDRILYPLQDHVICYEELQHLILLNLR